MKVIDARKLRRKNRRAAEKKPGYEIPWEPISMETLRMIEGRLRAISEAEDAGFWELRHANRCASTGKCDCPIGHYPVQWQELR